MSWWVSCGKPSCESARMVQPSGDCLFSIDIYNESSLESLLQLVDDVGCIIHGSAEFHPAGTALNARVLRDAVVQGLLVALLA